jgi:antirestriction protein ArdC
MSKSKSELKAPAAVLRLLPHPSLHCRGQTAGAAKADVYEQITSASVSAIEEGTEKYEMPWQALSTPLNTISRKPYRGVNVLMLWATVQKQAYTSNQWATYRQWQEAGAQVRNGERSTDGRGQFSSRARSWHNPEAMLEGR